MCRVESTLYRHPSLTCFADVAAFLQIADDCPDATLRDTHLLINFPGCYPDGCASSDRTAAWFVIKVQGFSYSPSQLIFLGSASGHGVILKVLGEAIRGSELIIPILNTFYILKIQREGIGPGNSVPTIDRAYFAILLLPPAFSLSSICLSSPFEMVTHNDFLNIELTPRYRSCLNYSSLPNFLYIAMITVKTIRSPITITKIHRT